MLKNNATFHLWRWISLVFLFHKIIICCYEGRPFVRNPCQLASTPTFLLFNSLVGLPTMRCSFSHQSSHIKKKGHILHSLTACGEFGFALQRSHNSDLESLNTRYPPLSITILTLVAILLLRLWSPWLPFFIEFSP